MKKRAITAIIALLMLFAGMTVFSNAAEERTKLMPINCRFTEVVAEGLTIAEEKERLQVQYRESVSGDFEKYQDVTFTFFDAGGNIVPDNHVISINDTFTLQIIFKAPEGKYFIADYQDGKMVNSRYPFNFDWFPDLGSTMGTSLSPDGNDVIFDKEEYEQAEEPKKEEIKKELIYCKIQAKVIKVESQWNLMINSDNKSKENHSGDQFLFAKYFTKREEISGNPRRAGYSIKTYFKLTHDIKANKDNHNDSYYHIYNDYEDARINSFFDLNGHTLDMGDSSAEPSIWSPRFLLAGADTTTVISDSSKEKTGRIINSNNKGPNVIDIESGGTLIINDGTIINNKSLLDSGHPNAYGGIYLREGGKLYLGGTASIKGNNFVDGDGKTVKSDIKNYGQIFIGDGTDMGVAPDGYVVEKPAKGFYAGIMQDEEGTFIEEAASSDAKYFFADNPNMYVNYNSGKLEIKKVPDDNYKISTSSNAYGTIYTNVQQAKPGDTVTVELIPKDGYKLAGKELSPNVELTEVEKNKYTFTMPSSNITVAANFEKIEYTPLKSGEMSFTEVVAEGFTVGEIKEKFILKYRNPTTKEFEEYNGVDYYFTDRAGNVKPDDYEITFGDEDLILVLIVKAPEERYFGARYDESKGIVKSEEYIPFAFTQFKTTSVGLGGTAGTGISSDGKTLLFDKEYYENASPDEKASYMKEMKYIKLGLSVGKNISTQWSLMCSSLPTGGETYPEIQSLFSKYFTKELRDKTLYITLNHDIKGHIIKGTREDDKRNSLGYLPNDLFDKFVIDLNGYTLDRGFDDTTIDDEDIYTPIIVVEGMTAIIQDSSENKTGKLIGTKTLGPSEITVSGNLILNGGSVLNNESFLWDRRPTYYGGIYVGETGKLYIGGSAVVQGNVLAGDSKTTKSDIHNDGGQIFIGDGTDMDVAPEGYVVEEPTEKFYVGIDQDAPGPFTENGYPEDADRFFSDNPKFGVAYNYDLEKLELREMTKWTTLQAALSGKELDASANASMFEIRDTSSSGKIIRNIKLLDDVTGNGSEDETLSVPSTLKEKPYEVRLDLNGHDIDRNLEMDEKAGRVLEIEEGAKLTVTDLTAKTEGDEYIAGKITGGSVEGYGGGIYVNSGGEFILEGGIITKNYSYQNSFGSQSGSGGGICSWGTLNIKGGQISENNDGGGANENGSAISIAAGSFNMSGGTISNNGANGGSAIYVFNYQDGFSFDITGGKIINNKTIGIDNSWYAKNPITLIGATISDNLGGVNSRGNVTLGGQTKIINNKENNSAKDLLLTDDAKIEFASPEEGMRVGTQYFTYEEMPDSVVISTSCDADYIKYLRSENNGYKLVYNDNHEIELRKVRLPGVMRTKLMLFEGWTVKEINELPLFTVDGKPADENIKYFLHDNSSKGSNSEMFADDYMLESGQQLKAWTVVKAPEGTYFESGFGEDGYSLRFDETCGIWTDWFRVNNRPLGCNFTGTDLSSDGKTLLIDKDKYDKGEITNYDVKYEACDFSGIVDSQHSLLRECINYPEYGTGDFSLFTKYFTYEDTDDGVRHIQLTHDIEAYCDDEIPYEKITVRDGINIELDLNGYTIDAGLTGEDNNYRGPVIEVMDGGILTITDTSSNATGKITGGNNTEAGGGIVVNEGGKLTMNGGEVAGNHSDKGDGGIYSEGETEITGNAKVQGNTEGDPVGDCSFELKENSTPFEGMTVTEVKQFFNVYIAKGGQAEIQNLIFKKYNPDTDDYETMKDSDTFEYYNGEMLNYRVVVIVKAPEDNYFKTEIDKDGEEYYMKSTADFLTSPLAIPVRGKTDRDKYSGVGYSLSDDKTEVIRRSKDKLTKYDGRYAFQTFSFVVYSQWVNLKKIMQGNPVTNDIRKFEVKDATSDGEQVRTIKLLDDIYSSNNKNERECFALEVSANSKVVLDLNGHILSRNMIEQRRSMIAPIFLPEPWKRAYLECINVRGDLTIIDTNENHLTHEGYIDEFNIWEPGKGNSKNSVTLSGGVICGGIKSGVVVQNDGVLRMEAGNISGNIHIPAEAFTTPIGGGVVLKDNAKFIMNGGAIRYNSPTGLRMLNDSEFVAGGTAVITDNCSGDGAKKEESNLVIDDGTFELGDGNNGGKKPVPGMLIGLDVFGDDGEPDAEKTGKLPQIPSEYADYFYPSGSEVGSENYYFKAGDDGKMELAKIPEGSYPLNRDFGNGGVAYFEPSVAGPGDKVNISVEPHDGYKLQDGYPKIYDKNGNDITDKVQLTPDPKDPTKFTITMPDAEFEPISVQTAYEITDKKEPDPGPTPGPTPGGDDGDNPTPNPQKTDTGKRAIALMKGTAIGNRAIRLSWGEIPGATEYVIYGSTCGNKLREVGKTQDTHYTIRKIYGKRLKPHKVYRIRMIANTKDGRVKGTVIHYIAGRTKGKYANVKSVTADREEIKLSVGARDRVSAEYQVYKNKKHLPESFGPTFKFRSDNKQIAKVDRYGNVTGVSAGTANIYIIDTSGRSCQTTVIVK